MFANLALYACPHMSLQGILLIDKPFHWNVFLRLHIVQFMVKGPLIMGIDVYVMI